ncbi:MAG: NADH-quinone oxidoreductase subunit NuoH [Anaerolineae bacterium]
MLVSLAVMVVKSIVIVGFLLTGFAYMTWLERKVVAHIQSRIGPNRAGPFGLLQPLADGLKLIFKEDIIPAQADKVIYFLAPAMSLVPALMAFAVVPLGPRVTILGRPLDLYLADVNIALLYVLAVSSLGVYGIVLAGWSSNNKYSLLGGLRSSAQMISYELALGLSIVGVLMLTGSFSLTSIVNAQSRVPFVVLQPLGFVIYAICAIAEVNRAPFDLPEAEQELIAGYHIEYSGLKFALFFMAEYINMITVSAIAVTLFWGGWRGPFLPPPLWFLIKVFMALFCFVWIRATFPRLRYDRLMALGWKVLLPLALINIMVTAAAIVIRDVYL